MSEIRISTLCRDRRLREIFRRSEDGGADPAPTVVPVLPKPILEDTAAARPEE